MDVYPDEMPEFAEADPESALIQELSARAPQPLDFSKFGSPVEPPTDGQKPQASPSRSSQPDEWGGYLPVIGKGLARGAIDVGATALKGADVAAASATPAVPSDAGALLDALEQPQSDVSRAALIGKAATSLPKPLAMDFNAAVQRIAAGSDPAAERANVQRSFEAWQKQTAAPVTERPLYKAGQVVQDFGARNFRLSPTDEQSITAQAARGIGGVAPIVAGSMLVGPTAAVAAGAGLMSASSAGQTYDDALAKGATHEDAAKAAGLSALVGGGLGALPLGVILRPIAQRAPGLTGWAAAKLEQALQSGAAFATVGEAQRYLGQQIAAEFYDPHAEYDFDPSRLAASLIAGGVLGAAHPLVPRGSETAAQPSEPSTPEQTLGARQSSSEGAPGARETSASAEPVQEGTTQPPEPPAEPAPLATGIEASAAREGRKRGAAPVDTEAERRSESEELLANAQSLRDPDGTRQAVWIPGHAAEYLRATGALRDIAQNGIPLINFDGKGGILLAKDRAIADEANQRRKSGAAVPLLISMPTREAEAGTGGKATIAAEAARGESIHEQASPERPEPAFSSIRTDAGGEDAKAAAPDQRTLSLRARARIADVLDHPTLRRLNEGIYDLSAPVHELQTELEARRLNVLPDDQAFYVKKRLFPGRVAAAVQDFNTVHLDPLVEFLRKHKISLDQAGAHAYARHAPERNEQIRKINPELGDAGSGMSHADAAAILSETTGKNPEVWAEFERRMDAIRKFIRHTMLSSGLESQAAVDTWARTYRRYAPLRGFEGEDEVQPRPALGGRFSVGGPESERALGRSTRADNPVVNLIDQAYRTVERAERNRYLKSLLLALQSMGDDVKDIVRIDKGEPKREIDANTGLVRFVETGANRFSPNAVAVKIGGKTHYMVFEDRQLAEAIKRMSPDQLGLLQPLLVIQNKIKALWTHYSPDFLARHFLARYPIEAALNGFEMKETGKHSVIKAFTASYPFLGEASRAIFARTKGKDAGEWGRYWDEMREHGGAMAFRQMRDTNLLREHLETQLMALKGKPIRTVRERWRRSIEAMDTVTNALDNALRLAAYASARKQGKSPDQAALIAREATVDFQLKGSWSNLIGLWFPFGNIAFQTGARMTKALYRSKTMRRLFAGTVAAGFAVSAFNYLVGGDDDDGIPYIEKVPEWDRRLALVIINPFDRDERGRPQPIKIPMPYNWAFPFVVGQVLAARAFGKMKAAKAMAMMLKSGIEALSPFGAEENPAAMVAPELTRPMVHVASNEDWTGRPVHTTTPHPGIPNAEMGRPSTGDGWKFIASGINRASGGNAYQHGAIDFYPEDYREIFDYVAGTQKRLGENAVKTAGSLTEGERPDALNVPIERVFHGADYDAADRNAYYDRRREAQEDTHRLRAAIGDRRAGKDSSDTDSAIERLGPKLGAHLDDSGRRIVVPAEQVFRQADRQIKALREQEEEARRDTTLNRNARERRVRALREQMRSVMNQAREAASSQ